MMWFGFSGARCRSSEIRQDKSSDQHLALEDDAPGPAPMFEELLKVTGPRHRADHTTGMLEPVAGLVPVVVLQEEDIAHGHMLLLGASA